MAQTGMLQKGTTLYKSVLPKNMWNENNPEKKDNSTLQYHIHTDINK